MNLEIDQFSAISKTLNWLLKIAQVFCASLVLMECHRLYEWILNCKIDSDQLGRVLAYFFRYEC